ncbi:MAG: phage tail sheath subtilisin-like domain-containing protein [Pseudomonadota bacterium]
MPVAVSYPGVYIEELPSGVRTITGVSTSVAAFVGWAPKGPTEGAELVLNWSDYERKFGGLDTRSLLGYAVSQFFGNGGQRAYIVRLAAADAVAGSVTLDGKLTVGAKSAGVWANDYAIVIKARAADAADPSIAKRFQLKVASVRQQPKGVPVEVFENLSLNPADPRFVVNVLKSESALVTAALVGAPTEPPADTVPGAAGQLPDSARLAGGVDGTVLSPDQGAFETAMLPVSGVGGVYLLDRIDLFNLLCVPGQTTSAVMATLQTFCRARRAFLIADSAANASLASLQSGPNTSLTGANAINAAFYFPWILAPDPLQENRARAFPPCGFVAGLYARTDASRGVWKAPAGTEASLNGVVGVQNMLTNDENGVLNPQAVNCIRTFPVYGTIVWGARTLHGNDERGSEWKYVPVRRTALFLEESLFRALKWVVFEPNDEPLWSQIRLNVGAFMQDLFRQGAFQGKTPQQAYSVKCDKETTTQNDIDRGIVNIVVAFAPLKPAEFVIIKIQQIAGQLQT